MLAQRRRSDKSAFQRHVAQLKALLRPAIGPTVAEAKDYPRVAPPLPSDGASTGRVPLGLELLSKDDLECAEVQFSAQLERALVVVRMSGF